MMNIGIIGFGKMGQIRFDSIRADGRGCVVGIHEPHQNVFLPEVRMYATSSELIADPNIHAVFVCTPNYLNLPLTIEALKAGKHVFCEKPPAFSAAEVEQIMVAEKNSNGKKLMYGFNHRHHDSIKKAKELIDSGTYGRILWMRGRYGKSVDKDFYNDWRSKREFAGGGILMDQGIHMLDLFLHLAGDFDEVKAFVSNLYWKLDVEDNVFAMLRNKQGVVASLHSSMTQWRHLFSLEIFLEKGYIVINGLLTSSGTYGEEVMTVAKNRTKAPMATWDDEEHIRFNVNNSWHYEMTHFLDAMIENKPIQTGNSADALKLMRIMDKIYSQNEA
ncbi:MAG: Gfo/Idh/MocA family oxidoreductase [Deltaproteobacteria bacterium]|nr:Gfo/Idh/MocA family oxidoreductase [Deltaproteobacteria bacterium]